MKIKRKNFSILALFLASPLLASAQAGPAVASPFADNAPQFFICVVAGVLLTIGFQALLTTLSVASGISAIGNIRKKGQSSSSSKDKQQKDDSGSTPMVKKISSAFGIWTMLTCTISLFFASFLAVKLSLVGANFVGVTLGLVIWAAFFTSILYLETKMVSSLVGSLFSTVMSGFRQSADMLSSAFSKSSESREKSVAKTEAHENARAMRQELTKLFSRNDLDKKLDDYVNRLSPQDLNITQIKKELKDLITDIEVEEKAELGEEGVTRHMFLETASTTPNISKEDVKKLSGVFDEVKGIAKSGGGKIQKAEKAVEHFTPASQEDIDRFKHEVSEYLKGTNKEELKPERMHQDLQTMLNDPKKAKGILQNKASHLDREAIVRMISQRKDVSRQDVEKYAGYAENAFNSIREKTGMGGGESQQTESHDYSSTYDDRTQPADIHITKKSAGEEGKTQKAKEKLQEFMSGLQEKKDYNLNQIKSQFSDIFSSSDGGNHESLTYKLKHYNKEEMRNFLKSNTSIPDDKAEMIADKAVEARDTVIEKANEVEREVNHRMEQVKNEALQQAENTRKAAASAAWWLTATAVLSGAASAIGGMIALDTWII